MSWIREPNAEPIAGYRLIEPLGAGGFGEVWKCEAPGGIHKAIKFVFGNLNSMDMDCVRAEQEHKALQRIKEVRHPFVCSMDRIEVVNGELLIVMELADHTLHDACVECQSAGAIGIPREDLLRYLRDAAEALDYMNEKHSLLHLDVKPKNLFLIGDRVKVADFGLVKNLERSSSGALGGVTPLYAPPETFLGKIAPTSDQYSLAIVYQEMLTGHRPFQAKNIRQLAQAHLKEEPDLRSVPEGERAVLARALAKDPMARFANCMALVAAIYKARSPRPSVAPPRGSKSMAETLENMSFEESGELVEGILDEATDAEENLDVTRATAVEVSGDSQPVHAANLGVTVPQPDTGSLRPTLFVGLGSFGRKALVELRCRLIDRFGDLAKLPMFRFLAIDTDPQTETQAMRGAAQVALTRGELLHAPLQPVAAYRKRNLDHLFDWLPREKLYAMPRSLQTQGSRALGRLAFSDNQQRILARMRREIQEITNADQIYATVSQTGLALRDTTPRVFLLTAAGGGSSGMLSDLGYAVRRLLATLRHVDSPVHAMLMCSAPSDPAAPKSELANIYATLTELNHYSDPSIPFAAQYGPDGQRIVDDGSPFSSVYLLPLANRTPEALAECVSHVGAYLFHETTTPLGLRLDQSRAAEAHGSGGGPGHFSTPLRSFGTYGVWFPRGLLLHAAAREASKRLVGQWCVTGDAGLAPEAQPAIDLLVERIAADPDLAPGAVAAAVEAGAQLGQPSEGLATPSETLAAMLAKMEEQILQQSVIDDAGAWSKQALHRVKEWIGSGDEAADFGEWRKTKVARALGAAAQKAVDVWDKKIAVEFAQLLEVPGARLAAAEAAAAQLQKWCAAAGEARLGALREQASRTLAAWNRIPPALAECQSAGSGFRLFGSKRGRGLRSFLDALAAFARARLAEETLLAVKNAYAALAGKIAERMRDFSFCRQRLRYLIENLDLPGGDEDEDSAGTHSSEVTPMHSPSPAPDAFASVARESRTARVVLPENETDLETAAGRFLHGLSAEHWALLDKELTERVLTPAGGLHAVCIGSGDLTKALVTPLLSETSQLLARHLPVMDVADVLLSEAGRDDAIGADDESISMQIHASVDRAEPLLRSRDASGLASFVVVPASKAGRTFAERVEEHVDGVQIVRAPGQADLLFLREQGALSSADVLKFLKPCRSAYQSSAGAPTASPHARFDVNDWLPLDPY